MADPSTTHALLIGIEQYKDGVNSLDGPANDVYRFAKWLHERGVPGDNISILLSPLEENKKIAQDIAALLGKTSLPPEATREHVDTAFKQLKKTQASLFLMLWGGHGWVTPQGDQRLYYADATREDYKNLNLSQQLTAMHSSYYAGIPEQVIIVDACANSWKPNKGEFPNDQPGFSDQQLPKLRQLAMFAASPGQFAENKGIEKAGLFSDEVLKQINALPAGLWPPDMKDIMNKVQQKFAELRAKGDYEQTPIYTLYIMDGNKENTGQVKPKSEVDKVQTSSVVLKRFQDLTPAEAEELRIRFLACPSINDSATRKSIVQQLRYEIANEFNKGGDDRDVMDLIKICFSYPHGVGELLYLMNFYERNSEEIKALRENVARIAQEKIPEQIEQKDRFKNLLFEQKNSLVRELLKCNSLNERVSRNKIIAALNPPIPNRVEREGKPREVVFSILEECDKRDGGFRSFLKTLGEEEENSSDFQQAQKTIKDLFA